MTEPWFDPNRYAWIPGTCLGMLGGLLGSVAGILAPRGKAKALVLGLCGFMVVACAGLLAAGVVALSRGQPYGIWYGLGLPGLIGVIVLGAMLPVIRIQYRMAEQRRLAARDL